MNVLKVETVLSMDRPGGMAPLALNLPGQASPALVYVRPHDLEITRKVNGRPAWTARIRRLTRLGGLVRLDLTLDDGTSLLVQLTRERCLELALEQGESVYVTPKDLKVFHRRRGRSWRITSFDVRIRRRSREASHSIQSGGLPFRKTCSATSPERTVNWDAVSPRNLGPR